MRKTCLFVLLPLLVSCYHDKNATDPLVLGKNLTVPQDLKLLDAWLQDRESRFSDLKADVNKLIVWNDPANKAKTPVALVYIHGYTATRKEIAPAPELLAKELKANLFYTRLTGHGLSPDGHKDVQVQDWLKDALEALEIGKRLGDRVVLVSTSTGGTLATWIAQSPISSRVAAQIMVSPNLTPKDPNSEMLLWPLNELFVKIAVGDYHSFPPNNDYKARYWDTKSHSHSLITMMQLVELARKGDFSHWTTPSLVFYDKADQVVNEEVTVKLLGNLPGVQLREVQNPGDPEHHLIVGDAESPAFTPVFVKESSAYLKKTLGL